jgi:hypothetical protein
MVPPIPKKMVWRVTEAPWRMEQRPLLLFLRGAQLVLWSSVLTVLDLDEVNVTLENAEIFGSVLSKKVNLLVAAGGAVEVLPVSLSSPCHSSEPALLRS